MMQHIRLITYNGDESWINETLTRSLPDGQKRVFSTAHPGTVIGIITVNTIVDHLEDKEVVHDEYYQIELKRSGEDSWERRHIRHTELDVVRRLIECLKKLGEVRVVKVTAKEEHINLDDKEETKNNGNTNDINTAGV